MLPACHLCGELGHEEGASCPQSTNIEASATAPAPATTCASVLAAAPPSLTTGRLTVLTLNVHGWHNEEPGAWSGLVSMLQSTNPDVIALQEATKHRVPALARAIGNYHWTVRHNCAILSRFPIGVYPDDNQSSSSLRASVPKHISGNRYSRCSVARITPREGLNVDVCCIHLDHVREPTRLAELRQLVERLLVRDRTACQVWLGDFNALTRSDVTNEEWLAIEDHRARNAWERPVSALTDAITQPTEGCRKRGAAVPDKAATKAAGPTSAHLASGLGFTDCWCAAQERDGPLGTSRFATRIDYIYCSPALMQHARVARCQHLQTIAAKISDHNGVMATLELAIQP